MQISLISRKLPHFCRRLVNTIQCSELLLSSKDCTFENVEPSMLEDVSDITPYFPQSYNFAGYINRSETLKKLVDLKVNLNKIEKKPHIAESLLKLDFNRDIKKHLWFLKDYVEDLGQFITKNPLILCQDLDDIQVRINYLESKHFSHSEICRIVTNNPFWLMFSTVRIDRRLGHFQNSFNLLGDEVRYVATKQPKIITYNLHHIKTNQFVIKEEMGFNDDETKLLLLDKPKLFMLNQLALLRRFNFLHNKMKLDHHVILQNSKVLLCRSFLLQQRHLFLQKLGRAQYNPVKENFVPITALAEDTDIEFCKKYAKCSVIDFNLFLKTL